MFNAIMTKSFPVLNTYFGHITGCRGNAVICILIFSARYSKIENFVDLLFDVNYLQ